MDWHFPILSTFTGLVIGVGLTFAIQKVLGTWRRLERRDRRDERREER
jgi:hypothetical protein